MRPAREQGLSLTGPDGLLKHVTETVIETALSEAMLSEAVLSEAVLSEAVTEHLGYGRRLLMETAENIARETVP
ncbi:MAG: putative transposase [Pseudonocardiales bacterium]|nr:putative transposase [Pseudonocardiales bacterium]